MRLAPTMLALQITIGLQADIDAAGILHPHVIVEHNRVPIESLEEWWIIWRGWGISGH